MKYTLQQRFYMFLAICIMFLCGYQGYQTRQADIQINKTLSDNNKVTSQYTQMYLEAGAENASLKKQIIALTIEKERAEEQVEILNNYWKNEVNKMNEELFILKNTKSSVNKKGKGGQE